MKIGLRLPTYCLGDDTPDVEQLASLAEKAEEVGFDSLWVVDHYLKAVPSYRVAFLDPLIVLAAMAGRTRELRLGTAIIALPLRNPVILAKEIASLDWISRGRFEFGVGTGWNEKEFEGVGVPVKERGRRTDEYLEIMTRLWSEETVDFDGRYFQFEGISLDPKPYQRPHPPISVAGGSHVKSKFADDPTYSYRSEGTLVHRVLTRIAKYADVWQVSSTSNLDLVREDLEKLAPLCEEYGRSVSDIEINQTSYVVLSDDEADAREGFGRIVGKDFDEFISKSSYLYGDAEKIESELTTRKEAGISRMILTPVTVDADELERWANTFLKPFL